ncbi:hypothetical protein CKO38_07955 [Rhodospirillum rubrum]|uniref:helix-turn-helix domain-containing protein n=1 Tax=Rhodospirillum rubrum TaxID=1085 RepID=UPI0019047698|nr:helix-turn-helix transcriptional regulator [Rhodospirillum rubrum]MBK1663946.1 hypothetical protein [Rhodospirillum rubrum]MBK1676604.1 hypothetical protein [Rhodospirillum rubrum]
MNETVTISREEYDALHARIEDLDDIVAGHAATTGVRLPHAFALRVIEREHPLRVWRAFRKLSASALAEKAGVSKAYLSEIETEKNRARSTPIKPCPQPYRYQSTPFFRDPPSKPERFEKKGKKK